MDYIFFFFNQTYLEEIVSLWPDFTSRGDNGKLLMSRYYSIPRGLNHTRARIQQEIEIWLNVYNKRYVLLIEADTHAHMTLHTRSEDGTYSRRACSTREITIPPNILPHLYGQLVQTTQVNIHIKIFLKGFDKLMLFWYFKGFGESIEIWTATAFN